MPLALEEQALLAKVNPPDHDTALRKANEFCAITRRRAGDLADLIAGEGFRASKTGILWYLRDEYTRRTAGADTRFMDAKVWFTITKHWPQPPVREFGFPLETKTSLLLKHRLNQAVRDGALCLVHGHVGTEKSFWLENLLALRQEQGKRDAIYLYCDEDLAPTHLLQRIAGEFLRLCPGEGDRRFGANAKEPIRQALLEKFAARPGGPPAIVLDEAQHLRGRFDTLEALRGLHERSRRGRRDPGGEREGCGILLAGSHDLRDIFEDPRVKFTQLAQWNDRFDHRDQLRGMEREEALRLAAAVMGNGRPARLSEIQQEAILRRSLKPDPYTQVCGKCAAVREKAKDACACGKNDWKQLEYFSARALVKYATQQKERKVRSQDSDGVHRTPKIGEHAA